MLEWTCPYLISRKTGHQLWFTSTYRNIREFNDTSNMPSPKQTYNLYKRLCPNDVLPWLSEESFYARLRSVISDVPAEDRLVLLGPFNARVGSDHETWGPTLGRFGRGNQNQNGELLAWFCTDLDLAIANTYFQHHDNHFLLVDSTKIQATAHAGLCCRKEERPERHKEHKCGERTRLWNRPLPD